MNRQRKYLNDFIWQGIDRRGKWARGHTTAKTLAFARMQLRHQGILVKRIHKYSKLRKTLSHNWPKTEKITILSRQLSTLITAGVPLAKALEIVAQGTNDINFFMLFHKIKNKIEHGVSLSTALGKHKKYFNCLFCNLVAVGEKSGTLGKPPLK